MSDFFSTEHCPLPEETCITVNYSWTKSDETGDGSPESYFPQQEGYYLQIKYAYRHDIDGNQSIRYYYSIPYLAKAHWLVWYETYNDDGLLYRRNKVVIVDINDREKDLYPPYETTGTSYIWDSYFPEQPFIYSEPEFIINDLTLGYGFEGSQKIELKVYIGVDHSIDKAFYFLANRIEKSQYNNQTQKFGRIQGFYDNSDVKYYRNENNESVPFDRQLMWEWRYIPTEAVFTMEQDLEDGAGAGAGEPEKEERTLKVEKSEYLPFSLLKQLQITNFAWNFSLGFVNPLNPKLEIPKHCLNVYLTTYPLNLVSNLGIIPSGDIEFVAQICTDEPGVLEPPDYEVICNCIQECPEGTCSLVCGDKLCCYNAQGIAVVSFDI